MSAFDAFMIQYQDADLMDINNVIFEAISEAGATIDSVETILPALFARGYVVVEIKKKEVDYDKETLA
jgi:hypothetical protein